MCDLIFGGFFFGETRMRTLVRFNACLAVVAVGLIGLSAGQTARAQAGAAVPAELVGKWSVSDGDLSKTIWQFRPNGTFELWVTINNKLEGKKYYLFEQGNVSAQGNQMTLTSTSATLVTEGNGQKTQQPAQLITRHCQWQIGQDPFNGQRVLYTVGPDGGKAQFYEMR
jgi:hypothetical protein